MAGVLEVMAFAIGVIGLAQQVKHIADTVQDLRNFSRTIESRQRDGNRLEDLARSTGQAADLLEKKLHWGRRHNFHSLPLSPRPILSIHRRLCRFCLNQAKKYNRFYRRVQENRAFRILYHASVSVGLYDPDQEFLYRLTECELWLSLSGTIIAYLAVHSKQDYAHGRAMDPYVLLTRLAGYRRDLVTRTRLKIYRPVHKDMKNAGVNMEQLLLAASMCLRLPRASTSDLGSIVAPTPQPTPAPEHHSQRKSRSRNRPRSVSDNFDTDAPSSRPLPTRRSPRRRYSPPPGEPDVEFCRHSRQRAYDRSKLAHRDRHASPVGKAKALRTSEFVAHQYELERGRRHSRDAPRYDQTGQPRPPRRTRANAPAELAHDSPSLQTFAANTNRGSRNASCASRASRDSGYESRGMTTRSSSDRSDSRTRVDPEEFTRAYRESSVPRDRRRQTDHGYTRRNRSRSSVRFNDAYMQDRAPGVKSSKYPPNSTKSKKIKTRKNSGSRDAPDRLAFMMDSPRAEDKDKDKGEDDRSEDRSEEAEIRWPK